MPELPEVEAERLKVDHACRKQSISRISVPEDVRILRGTSAVKVRRALIGAKILGTERRGKYFWLKLDRKPWPIFHLGMTGFFEVISPHERPAAQNTKVRLEFELENHTLIRFYDPRRFGRIMLAENPLNEEPVSALGYDPLYDFPVASELHRLLVKRVAPIKAILLDQTLFAGVGNWIADEVLFQAKISPLRKGNSLAVGETKKLRSAILSVIRTAVKVSADKAKFPKSWLFHQRWGKSKTAQTVAGEKIQHQTIGGRTTAWVPTQQR